MILDACSNNNLSPGYSHYTDKNKYTIIKSIYFHCDTLFVEESQIVKAGEPVALAGKRCTSLAHLYSEITTTDTFKNADFYVGNNSFFLEPVKFLNNHR